MAMGPLPHEAAPRRTGASRRPLPPGARLATPRRLLSALPKPRASRTGRCHSSAAASAVVRATRRLRMVSCIGRERCSLACSVGACVPNRAPLSYDPWLGYVTVTGRVSVCVT